jgi:short subunit dehydrogenase-like uncharacterized protein
MRQWMLYGAYGFTGQLIVEEAVRRGHRPVLAGRNGTKLRALAERYGLDHVQLALDDATELTAVVGDFDLVFHSAGPYSATGEPMMRACLAGRTHYVDITGELPVFETVFSYDEEARRLGISLICGAGFDLVPSDCLARYVAERLPDAQALELAIAGLGTKPSGGTLKTELEIVARGNRVCRDGRLVKRPFGRDVRAVRFSNGKIYTVIAAPLGDLLTVPRATGIKNVTAYLALPRAMAGSLRYLAPIVQGLLRVNWLRRAAQRAAGGLVSGPDAQARQTGVSYFWARASAADGRQAEAWLETGEAYALTARLAVRAVERVLSEQPAGALTPAQAFGVDFILEFEGSRRFDDLAHLESA